MDLTSDLLFRFPLMRGLQVRAVQQALARGGLLGGPADGIFGPATDRAVRAFQSAHQIVVDGIVGRETWSLLFSDKTAEASSVSAGSSPVPQPSVLSGQTTWRDVLLPYLERLRVEHRPPIGDGTVVWRLGARGVEVDGQPPRSDGKPLTASRAWLQHRAVFEECAAAYGVPVELLVATACTESGGEANLVREEPGYQSDEETPQKVSPGLMQTLISTARAATGDTSLNRAELLKPKNSVRAGACYIKQQAVKAKLCTNFDPPLVAIAYNAGSLHVPKQGSTNRWGLVQTERDQHKHVFHADAFVEYFNDFFAVLGDNPDQRPDANTPSFWTLLH